MRKVDEPAPAGKVSIRCRVCWSMKGDDGDPTVEHFDDCAYQEAAIAGSGDAWIAANGDPVERVPTEQAVNDLAGELEAMVDRGEVACGDCDAKLVMVERWGKRVAVCAARCGVSQERAS